MKRSPMKPLLKASKSNPDGPIRCLRCEGAMVHEKFYGLHEHFWGWRCVCCGEIVDQVVLENRIPRIAGTVRR